MKKYLIAGFITLLPIALTFLIATYLLDLFTDPFLGLAEKVFIHFDQKELLEEHRLLVLILSRFLILIFIFLLILLLGFLGRRFFFNYCLQLFNRFLLNIPFIRGIYRISKDVIRAFFSEETRPFKKAVLLPFPSQQAYAIGFVTSAPPSLFQKLVPQADLVVFVPTAPHPLSGFILLMSQSQVQDLPMSVEDAFKFLVSCGVIHPPIHPPSL
jgi:uncharacterized membrane protein